MEDSFLTVVRKSIVNLHLVETIYILVYLKRLTLHHCIVQTEKGYGPHSGVQQSQRGSLVISATYECILKRSSYSSSTRITVLHSETIQ